MGKRRLALWVAASLLVIGAAAPATASEVPPGGSFFDDDGSPFEPDIEALAAAGVTKGCNPEQTSFCPGNSVTRGQMAAFLVRALDLTEIDPAITFDDTAGSVFETDIHRLATAGVTKGCGDGSGFCPNDGVTRAQMAAFLTRALGYVRPDVEPRPQTREGVPVNAVELATADGCQLDDGLCTTTFVVGAGQSFHAEEGWFTGPWSQLPAAERADFQSNRIRTEMFFNGAELDTFSDGVVIIDDTAFKLEGFQFPSHLTGNHLLRVVFTDEVASPDFELIIDVTIVIDGAGGATATQAASPGGATALPMGASGD